MPKVTRKPEVRHDLLAIADHIAQDSLNAALRFLDAAEESFKFLSRNPEIGHLCQFENPETVGMRIWRVQGFENYLVFYRPINNGVDIVRVIYGGRDLEAIFGK
jgi:toxin ParE1/3/4